jgi:hypothetical protein
MGTQIQINDKRESVTKLLLNFIPLYAAYMAAEVYIGFEIYASWITSSFLIFTVGGLWWAGCKLIGKSYFQPGTKQMWYKGLKEGLKFNAGVLVMLLVYNFWLYKMGDSMSPVSDFNFMFFSVTYGLLVKEFNLAKS